MPDLTSSQALAEPQAMTTPTIDKLCVLIQCMSVYQTNPSVPTKATILYSGPLATGFKIDGSALKANDLEMTEAEPLLRIIDNSHVDQLLTPPLFSTNWVKPRAAHGLERGLLDSKSAGMTRRFIGGIAAAAALLLLQACASRSSFMGIPLSAGQTNPELRQLAARARAGDKRAQLELGIRFEEGRGVGRDIEKARDMYGLAASDSGGSVWVYIPSIGNGIRGRVMQVDRGPKMSGLAEAKARLHLLATNPGKN
ncbi:SEL1-like repeat protein [Sphingobium sp. H39-3-25]|uniref:SEL1-like repeat protein n=1 Tax=Sphingobium arseniciresistens TaxID=3030834 RepID=UPI0023B970BF|nr:SEL1-like repeat protein [Sphingobium arseniciresistens]